MPRRTDEANRLRPHGPKGISPEDCHALALIVEHQRFIEADVAKRKSDRRQRVGIDLKQPSISSDEQRDGLIAGEVSIADRWVTEELAGDGVVTFDAELGAAVE